MAEKQQAKSEPKLESQDILKILVSGMVGGAIAFLLWLTVDVAGFRYDDTDVRAMIKALAKAEGYRINKTPEHVVPEQWVVEEMPKYSDCWTWHTDKDGNMVTEPCAWTEPSRPQTGTDAPETGTYYDGSSTLYGRH